MRISDWSSDVCSSDLHQQLAYRPAVGASLEIEDEREAGIGDERERMRRIDRLGRQHRKDLFGEIAVEPVDRFLLQLGPAADHLEIGRASCRERVCQYV